MPTVSVAHAFQLAIRNPNRIVAPPVEVTTFVHGEVRLPLNCGHTRRADRKDLNLLVELELGLLFDHIRRTVAPTARQEQRTSDE